MKTCAPAEQSAVSFPTGKVKKAETTGLAPGNPSSELRSESYATGRKAAGLPVVAFFSTRLMGSGSVDKNP
jgi:hypothetical protein